MKKKLVSLFIWLFLIPAVSSSARDLSQLQSLDLTTAQTIALADNPSLMAAAERVEQAREQLQQAQSLYWPSIDTGGSYVKSRLSDSALAQQQLLAGISGAEIDRTSDNYNLSLVASWKLFDGFARKFNNLAAVYGQEESVQAGREGRRLLLQSVAESYYGAQLARYNLMIARANLDFNQQQLQEAQASYEAGAGSLSVVLNFKVQMNGAKTDMLLATKDQKIARYGLALLMGEESGKLPAGLELSDLTMINEAEFFPLETERLIEKALSSRPDLQRQEFALSRAESAVGSARAGYYPQLSLRGAFDGNRNEDLGFEESDFGSSLSLNFSYNLFKGGGDEARVAEARARKREFGRSLESRKNQVRTEVRQAVTRLEQAREQLLLQRASEALVRQTRDLVQKGYTAGQESLVRLNEAQRDLVSTQSRLALSLVALYTNRHSLKHVTAESLLITEEQ